MMREAFEGTENGTGIDLKVVTGAPAREFPAGYDEWRGRVVAKVESQARDGDANQELLETLEVFFGVKGARIVKGTRSRKKRVELPLPPEEAVSRVEDGMEKR